MCKTEQASAIINQPTAKVNNVPTKTKQAASKSDTTSAILNKKSVKINNTTPLAK